MTVPRCLGTASEVIIVFFTQGSCTLPGDLSWNFYCEQNFYERLLGSTSELCSVITAVWIGKVQEGDGRGTSHSFLLGGFLEYASTKIQNDQNGVDFFSSFQISGSGAWNSNLASIKTFLRWFRWWRNQECPAKVGSMLLATPWEKCRFWSSGFHLPRWHRLLRSVSFDSSTTALPRNQQACLPLGLWEECWGIMW